MQTPRSLATRILLAAGLSTLLFGQIAWAGSVDPCVLVSKADAGALLGSPTLAASASKAEKDEDTGGMLTFCTMRAKANAVVVSVVTFASATTDNGAQYTIVRGARVLGLALGGTLAKPPASYREPLRAVAVKALAKL